ncbi:MAG: hypothetical protein CV045_11745 [Cyanobacteria bacterium M5B4]|nr:MAG: hypothetical protein CV045_11745 [Cyanobacteria bacterium M5B4]
MYISDSFCATTKGLVLPSTAKLQYSDLVFLYQKSQTFLSKLKEVKEPKPFISISLSNGFSVDVFRDNFILLSSGEYVKASDLKEGDTPQLPKGIKWKGQKAVYTPPKLDKPIPGITQKPIGQFEFYKSVGNSFYKISQNLKEKEPTDFDMGDILITGSECLAGFMAGFFDGVDEVTITNQEYYGLDSILLLVGLFSDRQTKITKLNTIALDDQPILISKIEEKELNICYDVKTSKVIQGLFITNSLSGSGFGGKKF